ncbi:MAG: J domain-containing protein [Holophagaceae bacterium]|nr:J domain-containing protein [Holophagaceae bacterium]
MNPFEILQIRPGASPDEVKAAYHQLAKQWHPDKFLGAEKLAAEDKFRSISEAYAAIKSGVALLPPPQPASQVSPQKEKTPNDWLATAKQTYSSKQYDKAISLCQYCFNYPAVAEDAHLIFAKILVETGKDSKAQARAFEDVIRINPNNREAVAKLAELYLVLNMPTRAASMSAKAKALGATSGNKSQTVAGGGSEGIFNKVAGIFKH